MHTAAPDRYRGPLDWEKLLWQGCDKMLNAERLYTYKKPSRFLKGFAMHTAAPDRYCGLLGREKLARNIGEKGLNAKKPAFQLAL